MNNVNQSGHPRNEARSAAFHLLVLKAFDEDAAAVRGKALANIARWRKSVSPRSAAALDAWEEILRGDTGNLRNVLVSDEQACVALRQSSPFPGVVSSKARWGLYGSAST